MITQISDFNVMVTINKDNASAKAISPIMELAGKSFYPGRLVKSGGHRYMEVGVRTTNGPIGATYFNVVLKVDMIDRDILKRKKKIKR